MAYGNRDHCGYTRVIVGGTLFIFWPQAAFLHAISEIYLGREIQVLQAYRFALTKIVRFVLTTYMMMFAMLGLLTASGLAAVLVLIPFAIVLGLTGDVRSLVLDDCNDNVGVHGLCPAAGLLPPQALLF